MWDSIIKPTLVLFVVCLIVSGSLAYVNDITKNIIDENTLAEQEAFRRQVLPEADRFEKVSAEGIPEAVRGAYQGFDGDSPAGFVMEVTAKGYGGDISMTVGIDMNGQITRVIIGSNSETPGLGSKATLPDFINQFTGIGIDEISEDGLAVVKGSKTKTNEIEAVSGATVSSRGITKGVQTALDAAELIKGGH